MEEKYFHRLTLMTVFTFNFAFLNLPVSPFLFMGFEFEFGFRFMQSINETSECLGQAIPSLIITIIFHSIAHTTRNLPDEIPQENAFC